MIDFYKWTVFYCMHIIRSLVFMHIKHLCKYGHILNDYTAILRRIVARLKKDN